MNDLLSQGERDHADRAKALLVIFGSKEVLAEFLHQQYRAAAKAAAREHDLGSFGPAAHNHGWSDCYGHMKRYFLRRAAWLLDPRGTQNGWPSRHIVDEVLAL